MRELNEQELVQVAGGYTPSHGQASAKASSQASMQKGLYASTSNTGAHVGRSTADAYADNTTLVIGCGGVTVSSGAASSASH
jgi:hypothetical protein